MALVIPPGFAHVAIEHRHAQDPDPWYVTYGIDIDAWGGDYVALGEAELTRWWGNWQQFYGSQVQFPGCQITIGQDGPDPVRMYVNAPEPMGGTSPSEKLPQNCALLVRKNTALGGRRNRGRMFLPGGLTEGNVNNVGVIDASIVTILQSYAVSWLSSHNDDGGPEVNLSPLHILHSDGNSAIIPPTIITSLQVDSLVSTQRRRLR